MPCSGKFCEGPVHWSRQGSELGAAFLCADLGITPEVREDHAAYLTHWLQVLKEDKRAIFTAAAHAQRAADTLHALQEAPAEMTA